jgi:hypothetical protein
MFLISFNYTYRMEEISEVPVLNKTNGFIKHVFNFDIETKNELINIVQYGILCIIPIVILNKTIKQFIPEADESKGSLEVGLEIVGQMVILFFGIYFIHRIVTYFPTYSGNQYGDLNMFNVILAFLVIVLSLQTKLGEKIEILANRGLEYIGYPQDKEIEEEVDMKVSRPINNMVQPIPQHQGSRSDIDQRINLNDSIRDEMMRGQPQGQQQMQVESQMQQPQQQPQMQQQAPAQRTTDFNSMFSEPMAANEGFGGFSAF